MHVLSQPPVQGKAAVAGIKKAVSSEYFPQAIYKAVLQLAQLGLENPSLSLLNSTVDALIFGFLTREDVLYQKRQVVTALNALYQTHPGAFEARVGKQLSKVVSHVEDDQILWALYLVVSVNRAWDLIDQPTRDKLEAVVGGISYENLAPAIDELGRVPQLRPVVEARVQDFDLDQLAGVIQAGSVAAANKDRAIEILTESRSWDRTNAVFDKAVLPLFATLQPQDVRRVLRLPTEHDADLPGAHGFGLFVQNVRESEILPQEELNQLLRENRAGYLVPQS